MSTKKKPAIFPCTDSGNGEMFAHLYGDRFRFDHKQGRWLVWNERQNRWAEDTTESYRVAMRNTARKRVVLAAEMSGSSDAAINTRKQQAAWGFKSEEGYRIDAALKEARSIEPISDDGSGWDADPWQFGVRNGIINLKTGEHRGGTQADRITKFSPVVFDPAAECPRFERFLQEIFDGDSDLIDYVQKAVGYSLTGSVAEQCLFACHGEGGNGKTTLLEILLYLFGDYGTDLPFNSLETKHYAIGEGVNLPGARFVKSIETRKGRQLDEGRIKSWTGGDTITIRPLHRNAFQFQPTHTLWLSFNDKPKIVDDSPAMWRRIKLVPFLKKFEGREKDKGLLEKLKAELPGILNWAIQGCLLWQREGLQTPARVIAATYEYQDESNVLVGFFEDHCEFAPEYSVLKGELWNAYLGWCWRNREKHISRKEFCGTMERRGFVEGRTKKTRSWEGLRLRVNPPGDTGDAKTGTFALNPIGSLPIEINQKHPLFVSPVSPPPEDTDMKRVAHGLEACFSAMPTIDVPETPEWVDQ